MTNLVCVHPKMIWHWLATSTHNESYCLWCLAVRLLYLILPPPCSQQHSTVANNSTANSIQSDGMVMTDRDPDLPLYQVRICGAVVEWLISGYKRRTSSNWESWMDIVGKFSRIKSKHPRVHLHVSTTDIHHTPHTRTKWTTFSTQDIHVMVFMGFAFIAAFLHKYGYRFVSLYVHATMRIKIKLLPNYLYVCLYVTYASMRPKITNACLHPMWGQP